LDEASTQVFDSVGGVLAEGEATLSGTTDSAHVASVGDPFGGSEHSAITLLQASGALTLIASTTSAITRNSMNILAVGDQVSGSEHSFITLLQATSAAFNFTSATSTAIKNLNEALEPTNRGHSNEVGHYGHPYLNWGLCLSCVTGAAIWP
jgi:hypothetical protein